MKKLDSWREMVVGAIYNSVYVGDNKAYAKVNGKQTIVILGKDPLRFQELFDQHGDPFTIDMRDSVITSELPDKLFEHCEIYEPANETEWFKKAVRFDSITTAVQLGLVTMEWLKHLQLRSNYFVPHFGAQGKMQGVVGEFCVEDKTQVPFLQTVVIVWKNWSDLFADFERIGIDVEG